MKKKLILIALTACSIFAVNFSVSAADATAKKVRKAGGFDRTRPNNFTATMKKIGRFALLYIPNRLADVSDIVTFDLSIGGDFSAEIQATRYFQLGVSNGENWFIAKAYNRQYGAGHKDTTHYGFLFMEKEVSYVDETSGSVKEYVIDFPQFSIADYQLDAFQDKDVDFWKIGGHFGWILGGGFGIHPIEIADCFLGIFGLDISKDDF